METNLFFLFFPLSILQNIAYRNSLPVGEEGQERKVALFA